MIVKSSSLRGVHSIEARSIEACFLKNEGNHAYFHESCGTRSFVGPIQFRSKRKCVGPTPGEARGSLESVSWSLRGWTTLGCIFSNVLMEWHVYSCMKRNDSTLASRLNASARRYCDPSCLLVGWFVCSFAGSLVASDHRLQWQVRAWRRWSPTSAFSKFVTKFSSQHTSATTA